MSKRRLFIVLAIFVVALLAAGGCGSAATPPQATEAETESGGCFEGFPRYPGVQESEEIQAQAETLLDSGYSEARGYSSSDSMEDVAAFYKQEPANLGWESASDPGEDPNGVNLWWETAESSVYIIINQNEGEDTVIVLACQMAE